MGNYCPMRTHKPTLTRLLHGEPLWLKFSTKFGYQQYSHPKNTYNGTSTGTSARKQCYKILV